MPPRPVATTTRLTLLVVAGLPFSLVQGAVFPYLVLYLHDDLRFPTALAGLTIGLEGVAALVGALAGGSLQDRIGPRSVAILGSLLQGAAYLGLVAARSVVEVALCFAVLGLASMRYPSRSNAILLVLPDDLSPTRFFSWDFMSANAGFGIGIVLGAVVVSVHEAGLIRGFFVASSLVSVVLAGTYTLLPNVRHCAEPSGQVGGYLAAMRLPLFWLVGLWGLLLSMASYSSFDAGIPAFVGIFLHASPRIIALGFATNPLLIVVLQRPMTRLVERLGWRRAAIATSAIFGLAWLVLLATLWLRTPLELTLLLVVFAAIFSVAEMLLAPIRSQITAALAPAGLRGRFFGVNHFARGVAGLIGPSLAGLMIGDGLGFLWLPLVGAFGAGATLAVRRIFRLAPAELAERA